ncbi:MAG: YbhB/YbcL family Raf kinase inhibitor-like protein [Candidatus Levyibacteriota bacterium]
MKILSKAFANKQSIPKQYTCDGKGINPEVQFEAVPAEAKSLVLLMDDPDVPKNLKPDGVFDHWVVYNIDPTVKEISENSKPPGIEGLNGTGKLGFTPPCPPDREHRYFFKLYALSTMLDLNNPERVTKDMVLQKMQRHIIEEAELVGVYNRLQNQK